MEKKYCKYPLCGKLLFNTSDDRKYCANNNNKCKNDNNYLKRKIKLELANKIIVNSLIYKEYEARLEILMKNRRIKIIPGDDFKLMGIDINCQLLEIKDKNESFVNLKFRNFKIFHFVDVNVIAIYKSKAA